MEERYRESHTDRKIKRDIGVGVGEGEDRDGRDGREKDRQTGAGERKRDRDGREKDRMRDKSGRERERDRAEREKITNTKEFMEFYLAVLQSGYLSELMPLLELLVRFAQ